MDPKSSYGVAKNKKRLPKESDKGTSGNHNREEKWDGVLYKQFDIVFTGEKKLPDHNDDEEKTYTAALPGESLACGEGKGRDIGGQSNTNGSMVASWSKERGANVP